MTEKFFADEADFNLLLKMANDDSRASLIGSHIVGLENQDAWPPAIYLEEDKVWLRSESELGFTRLRWDEYRKLFKKLNLKYGINRKHEMPDAVFFTLSIDYSPLDEDYSARTEKGYVYSAKGIYNSLSGALDGVKINRPAIFFKQLNDNDHWYLFYEWAVAKPE